MNHLWPSRTSSGAVERGVVIAAAWVGAVLLCLAFWTIVLIRLV